MRMLENFLLLLALGGSFIGAVIMWAKAKTKKQELQAINKGNEDATKIRNKVRTDRKYRDLVRKLFDGK